MLWIMAFHIIFLVCWFSGIFYLPRLFVYHAMTKDEAGNARFKTMERKLYRFTTPFGIIATALGIWLITLNPEYYMKQMWFHIKLGLVILLWIYHLWCGYTVKVFANDNNKKSHVYYRVLNELPVFLLFAIVILVTVKPHF